MIEAVRSGDINQYLVCGTDIYRSLACAKEDGTEVDRSRTYADQFFSSSYFQIIDLLDVDESISCSDLEDVVRELGNLGCAGISVLNREVVEQTDFDATYILTPLADELAAYLAPMLD